METRGIAKDKRYLPNELMMKIYEHCDPEEQKTLRLASKTMHQMACVPSLRKQNYERFGTIAGSMVLKETILHRDGRTDLIVEEPTKKFQVHVHIIRKGFDKTNRSKPYDMMVPTVVSDAPVDEEDKLYFKGAAILFLSQNAKTRKYLSDKDWMEHVLLYLGIVEPEPSHVRSGVYPPNSLFQM